MAKTTYAPEVKAQAMAALLQGQSVSQVAAAYRIPLATVRTWQNRHVTAVRQATDAAADAPLLGNLIFANLEAMLKAVQEIVTCVSKDTQWLKTQSASELAVFIGVCSDKAFRILEALPEPDQSGNEPADVHPAD